MNAKEIFETLCIAVVKNEIPTITSILDTHPELVNMTHSDNDKSPMDFAVEYNKLEAIKLLAERKADPCDAFINAVSKGQINVCQYMLENKIINTTNIDHEDKDKCTALIAAINVDELEIAQLLLDYGASKTKAKKWKDPEDSNINLLQSTAIANKPDTCKLIIENKLYNKIDSEDDCNRTALTLAIINISPNAAKILIDNNASIEKSAKWKNTSGGNRNVLHYIAKNGDAVQVLPFLSEYNFFKHINIDCKDSKKYTPVILALRYNNSQFASKLFDLGADKLNVKNWRHQDFPTRNILHFAAFYGHLETCKTLFEYGIFDKNTIDMEDNSGSTASIFALIKSNLNVVKFLLEKGASKEKIKSWRFKNKTMNRTILHYAAQAEDVELFKFIIDNNLADVNEKTELGLTAGELAQVLGKTKIVNLWNSLSLPKINNKKIKKLNIIMSEDLEINNKRNIELVPTVLGKDDEEIKSNDFYLLIIASHTKNIAQNLIAHVNKFNTSLINVKKQLELQFNGKSGKKYPQYNEIIKIQTFDVSYIQNNLNTIQSSVTNNARSTSDKTDDLSKLQENLLKQSDDFNLYNIDNIDKISHCEEWINAQPIKVTPTKKESEAVNERVKRPAQSAIKNIDTLPSLEYFIQICSTHNIKQCSSRSKRIQKLWRFSVGYFILMTTNLVEKNTNNQHDLALLRDKLTQHIYDINTSTLENIKFDILQYHKRYNISSNSIEDLEGCLSPLDDEITPVLSDKPLALVTKIKSALSDIQLIINSKVITRMVDPNFNILSNHFPHHTAAIKMLIIHIESLYTKSLEVNKKIPVEIQQYFQFGQLNLTDVKNRIFQQKNNDDEIIINYLSKICGSIDNGIRAMDAWEKTLKNGVSHLPLAGTSFNITTTTTTTTTITTSTTNTVLNSTPLGQLFQ